MSSLYPPGELVIGTVMAPFKAESKEVTQWLEAANSMVHDALLAGFTAIHFFASVELDSRGMAPYQDLTDRMATFDIYPNTTTTIWKFAIDDGAENIDAFNRLVRICAGRNLIHEFAIRNPNVSHVLFLDSDVIPQADCISKLLEVDSDIVGGDVPSYCLSGPRMDDYPFHVERHWNTAGFLLVRRRVIQKIRWRADIINSGLSDDPCFNIDAVEAGFAHTLVRKDVVGRHTPLKGLHDRGHDLKVYK